MLPFALAVLIFYLFPLIAAVIATTLGWEKFNWQTAAAIVLALVGLALALGVRGVGNLDAVRHRAVASRRRWARGRHRRIEPPVRRRRRAPAHALHGRGCLCAVADPVRRQAAISRCRRRSAGWIGFVASSVVYGFAMIAFFIAVSMIGPVRASLLSYADAVISAGLGVVVLGQTLTMVQVAGIALVIIALVGATLK